MAYKVFGKKYGKSVELRDDGASAQEFVSNGNGSVFESMASAQSTLDHHDTPGVTDIEILEVAKFDD